MKTTSLLKEDRSNPYLADQLRRSGIPVRRNSRARSEQEKRKAIKAPVQLAKQSNTQSRETKLDQVRASIVKHSGKNPSSSVDRTITRSQTKFLSPGPSHQNLNHVSQEINATYLISPSDILPAPHYFAHCLSTDLAMTKGLARQSNVDALKYQITTTSTIHQKLAVLIYFDPPFQPLCVQDSYQKHSKASLHINQSVLVGVSELREVVITERIIHFSLPKLTSSYDNFNFNIFFNDKS